MDNQKKHLRHVILYCFEKGDSANNTADEICIVYGSGAITITIIHNWFKRFRAGNFDSKDKANEYGSLSRLCSLKIRDIVCARLGFCIKMCIENTLDLRTIDLQLVTKPGFHSKKVLLSIW
ncbi:histone-lysine N-methyltransferase [Apis cerana cerana]|uniref:Histone-lysine N-methyltransferase n=1 Tax=Apis cerana cerana TaxID=94128 RepID=A0A2A3E8B3_APICC|nr:histone-lysine N-methyltransferase [Apis cerana cerana]